MVHLNSRSYFAVLSIILILDSVHSRPIGPLLLTSRDASVTSSTTVQGENQFQMRRSQQLPILQRRSDEKSEEFPKDPKEFGRLSTNHGVSAHAFSENELSSLRNPIRKRRYPISSGLKKKSIITVGGNVADDEGDISDGQVEVADAMYPLRIRNSGWLEERSPFSNEAQSHGNIQNDLQKRSKVKRRSIKKDGHESEESNHYWTTDDDGGNGHGKGVYWIDKSAQSQSQSYGNPNQNLGADQIQPYGQNGKIMKRMTKKRSSLTRRSPDDQPHNTNQYHNANQSHNSYQAHNVNQPQNKGKGGYAGGGGGDQGGSYGGDVGGSQGGSYGGSAATQGSQMQQGGSGYAANNAGQTDTAAAATTTTTEAPQGDQGQSGAAEKRSVVEIEEYEVKMRRNLKKRDQPHNLNQDHNTNQTHNTSQDHNVNQYHNKGKGSTTSGYSGNPGGSYGTDQAKESTDINSGNGIDGTSKQPTQDQNSFGTQKQNTDEIKTSGYANQAGKSDTTTEAASSVTTGDTNAKVMLRRRDQPHNLNQDHNKNQSHNLSQDHNKNQYHNSDQTHNKGKGKTGSYGGKDDSTAKTGTSSGYGGKDDSNTKTGTGSSYGENQQGNTKADTGKGYTTQDNTTKDPTTSDAGNASKATAGYEAKGNDNTSAKVDSGAGYADKGVTSNANDPTAKGKVDSAAKDEKTANPTTATDTTTVEANTSAKVDSGAGYADKGATSNANDPTTKGDPNAKSDPTAKVDTATKGDPAAKGDTATKSDPAAKVETATKGDPTANTATKGAKTAEANTNAAGDTSGKDATQSTTPQDEKTASTAGVKRENVEQENQLKRWLFEREDVNPALQTYFNTSSKRKRSLTKKQKLIKRQDTDSENPYLTGQDMDDDSSSDIDKLQKPDHVQELEDEHDECMENEKQGILPSGTCEAQRMSSALAGSVRKREESSTLIPATTTNSTITPPISPPTTTTPPPPDSPPTQVRQPSQTEMALEALTKLSDLQAKRNDVQEQEKLVEKQIHDLFKQYPVLSATLAL